jgi:hypothetical protein
MKRSLIIVVPLLLLAILNACSANMGALPAYSNDQWTAIARTQQVMARPESEKIKFWLNSVPYNDDKFTSLEKELVGYYDVTNVGFPKDTYFEIYLNCQCASGSSCCDPERMFLIALQKINRSQSQILAEVPDTVQDFDVVCLNNTAAFAAVYAPWDKVKTFLTTTDVVTAKDLKSSISVRGIP